MTPSAVTGLEELPRSPSPSNGVVTRSPSAVAGTSQIVLMPSAAKGRLDQTYRSAFPAAVIQLFLASSRTLSPEAAAVLTGAQKWLRDPASEKARVATARPSAIASRTVRGPWASITAAAA